MVSLTASDLMSQPALDMQHHGLQMKPYTIPCCNIQPPGSLSSSYSNLRHTCFLNNINKVHSWGGKV